MATTMQDVIERAITVKAPMERVYNAITDPKQIIAWFPDAIDGTLGVGDCPLFDFGADGKARICVCAADPFDYFAYRWVPASIDHGNSFLGDVLSRPNTLVEFRLKSTADGTVVTLRESGFAGLPAEVAEKSFSDNSGGWDYMMNRLAELMSKG
jgi:uncharacterized protein YndB with AHSA1/START domain